MRVLGKLLSILAAVVLLHVPASCHRAEPDAAEPSTSVEPVHGVKMVIRDTASGTSGGVNLTQGFMQIGN